mmetsp:Transcript_8181/g.16310  ORF Transcript_8181/g.16310 Transcript_8181/m.16310 type:complete len:95 (+) Transcript_8181:36-320(+)
MICAMCLERTIPLRWRSRCTMAAIFNFSSWLTVLLLFICACAFLHRRVGPYKMGDSATQGVFGLWWKAARIGERLSPWVAVGCVCMAIHALFIQ